MALETPPFYIEQTFRRARRMQRRQLVGQVENCATTVYKPPIQIEYKISFDFGQSRAENSYKTFLMATALYRFTVANDDTRAHYILQFRTDTFVAQIRYFIYI